MKKLLEPAKIGTLEIKNRIVYPAIATLLGAREGAVGTVTQPMINFYSRIAKGGAGLITVEVTAIHPSGLGPPMELRIFDDKYIQGLSELASKVKEAGAKIAIQLRHAGRQANSQVTGQPALAPSKVPGFPSGGYSSKFRGEKNRLAEPEELKVDQIKMLIDCFIEGARRSKAAGFDAVELHGAHGYLLWQFLSPLSNNRTDEYGRDVYGRSKFAVEIVQGIKKRVGKEFPVIFRLSASDFIEGGLTLSETKKISQLLEEAGADAIHVSGGCYEAFEWVIQPMILTRGCLVHLAEAIRKEIHIPVITVGRINDPEYAESILQEGEVDLVAMGRALLADPDLPNKAKDGRIEDIRKCIACNICWHDLKLGGLRCAINPELGKGPDFITKTDRARKVIVVGGGPAGLEAARVARLRGHHVTLFEAGDRLGGQINLATKASYKEELKSLVPYYQTQLEKLGVKVKLKTKVTPAMVEEQSPDAVVIATGSVPLIPDIPGIRQDNVYTAWDVLEGRVQLSGKVLIVGGGSVGCETADYLYNKGLKPIILEATGAIASDVEPYARDLIVSKFDENKMEIITKSSFIKIDGPKVTYQDEHGEGHQIMVNHIVIALGSVPENSLGRSLEGKGFSLHSIGDCAEVRKILDAIFEGAEIGRKL